MSVTDVGVLVMYAPTCECDTSVPLVPNERYLDVVRCKNEKVKREKYLVWKLLERAIKERFKLDFANLEFTKRANGQWVCPGLYFSLSHTDGAVCVAISDKPVGVDIEMVRPLRPELLDRALTPDEREYAKGLGDDERLSFFLEAWVKKESLFKRDGGECLSPRSRDTLSTDAKAHRVTLGSDEYLIGLAYSENKKYEIIYTEEI